MWPEVRDRPHGEAWDRLRTVFDANLFTETIIFIVGLVVTIVLALGYSGLR